MAALGAAGRLRTWLTRQWFDPNGSGPAPALLAPLAALYGVLVRLSRRARQRRAGTHPQPACPVIVVGNLVVGGAGKTPVVIGIVRALQAAGRTPGVVSRGYGRSGTSSRDVTVDTPAACVGDEPLLISLRTRAPVRVGRDRAAAACSLLAQRPDVDVIVADDGLQHRQLRRDVEVIVFDERGIGNGRLLPAGPLREPFTRQPEPQAMVLYNHPTPTTGWRGACARSRLTGAWPLAAWLGAAAAAPLPLERLRGRRLLAMAGIAVPERFFAALEAAGLSIERLPLPDHHRYATAPWPAEAGEVITTEKDAVKLARWAEGGVTIWVVGLDLELPPEFAAELMARLPGTTRS